MNSVARGKRPGKKAFGGSVMIRVILIIIDGCRADALQHASTPNLYALSASGVCSLEAVTVVPSITLPAHFSLFTSQKPISHSVLANTGMPLPSPSSMSFFEWIKSVNKSAAAVYGWENLRNLSPPGVLAFSLYLNVLERRDGDLQIAAEAADRFRRSAPDFLFVYLGGLDKAGHDSGWMSRPYLDALETADAAVGILLENLSAGPFAKDTVVVVQSDHGGTGFSHEEMRPENLRIPWIASGPRIRKGYRIPTPVSILDTVPTLACLMGVPPHHTWEGRCLEEILDASDSPEGSFQGASAHPKAMAAFAGRKPGSP